MDLGQRHRVFIDLDTALGKEISGQRVMIVGKDHDSLDPGGDDRLGAGGARHVGHIGRRPVDGMTAFGGLDECVHLRVHGTHAVIVDDKTADFIAMDIAGDRAVVAGRYHFLVLDEHGAAMHARTRGPLGGEHRELQKIFIPIWSFRHNRSP